MLEYIYVYKITAEIVLLTTKDTALKAQTP